MFKISILIALLFGILVGLWFFIMRITPSANEIDQASRFKRSWLLTALMISALLSYACCISHAKAQAAAPAATNISSTVAVDLETIKKSKEWQELRVFWKVITGSPEIFSDGRSFFFPRLSDWHYSLLKIALQHRIAQLDPLVAKGAMTLNTQRAIQKLANDVAFHFYRSNCGATCYMMAIGKADRRPILSEIMQQANKLRDQYQKGALSDEDVRNVETGLREKLRALEILEDFTPSDISNKDIQARYKKWKQDKRFTHKSDYWDTRKKIKAELIREKEATIPSDQLAIMKAAWASDQQTVITLAVDLDRYKPDREAEKALKNEITGKEGVRRLLEALSQVKDNRERQSMVMGLDQIGGDEAVPHLQELLKDETLDSFSRSDGTSRDMSSFNPDNPDAGLIAYIRYPIRDEAAKALKRRGLPAPAISEARRDSPEGIAIIKHALLSTNAANRQTAIYYAGKTKEREFVPILTDIAKQNSNTVDAVINALGEIGDPACVPFIFSLVPQANPHNLSAALGRLGGPEARTYLTNQIVTAQDPEERVSAIAALEHMNDTSTAQLIRHTLTDTNTSVQFYAAKAMDAFGYDDGLPILSRLAKDNDNQWWQSQAIETLKKSRNPKAREILASIASTPDGTAQQGATQAVIAKGGQDGLHALARALKDPQAEQRHQAFYNINPKTMPVEAETLLIEALRDPDKSIAWNAIDKLGSMGTTNALDALCAFARAKHTPDVPAFFINQSIERIRCRDANQRVGDLLTKLASTDPQIKAEAESRKSKLNDTDLTALIIVAHDNTQKNIIRQLAEQLLAEMGERSIGPIIDSFAWVGFRAGFQSAGKIDDQFVYRTELKILDRVRTAALPRILGFIADSRRQGREYGIEFLRREYEEGRPLTQLEGAVSLINTCRDDMNPNVRTASVRLSLELTQDPEEAIDIITDALADPDWQVRQAAVTFKNFKPDFYNRPEFISLLVPALIESLSFESPLDPAASDVIALLGKSNDKRSIPALTAIVRNVEAKSGHESHYIPREYYHYSPRQEAVRTLFSIGDASLVPLWSDLINDSDPVVAIWSRAALCKYGTHFSDDLQGLDTILTDAAMADRTEVIKAIEALGDPRCLPILASFLETETGMQADRTEALPRIGTSDEPRDREKAMQVIVALGGTEALNTVQKMALSSKSSYVRREAASLLPQIADPGTETILVQCLRDPSSGVRYTACEHLAAIGTTNAIPALKGVADSDSYQDEDGRYEVREAAAKALKTLEMFSSPEGAAKLIAEATDAKNKDRLKAIRQLGRIQHNDAVVKALTDLLAISENKCPNCGRYHLRSAAADALKRLGVSTVLKENGQYNVVK